VVAAGTILGAEFYGLPESTTHVLSSGMAGTMAANGSGLPMAPSGPSRLSTTAPDSILFGAKLPRLELVDFQIAAEPTNQRATSSVT